MALSDTLVLELTADRGAGDEIIRISNKAVSGSTDIHPRLAGIPEYSYEVGLWIWQTQTVSGVGNAEIVNTDGWLDWLQDAIVRDKPARLLVGNSNQPFNTFTVEAQLVVDFLGTGQANRIIVVFASTDALLQQTWQSDFYLTGTPNARIIGQPVPVSLGHVYQVPAILETPNTLAYAVHTVAPAEVIEVQSNGNPALVSQWDAAGRGFEMSVTPSGRITAEVKGSAEQVPAGFGSDIVGTPGQFKGTSGNPVGWTVVESGANTIGLVNNRLDEVTSTTTPASITRNIGMTPAVLHRLDVQLFNGQFGSVRSSIKIVDTDGIDENIIQDWTPATGSALQIDFTPVYSQLRVLFRLNGGSFSSLQIDNLTVKPQLFTVTPLLDLAGILPYVAEQAGWDPADIDTTGIAALSTAIGAHELGLWLDSTSIGTDILRQLTSPFLAWAFVDADSILRAGRLLDPADIPGDPVLEVTKYMIPEGEVPIIEDDLMPGLTDTYGGRRNWLPIPQESSAGAISSDMQKREDVAATFRFIETGDGTDIDPFYAWAHNRCIFASTLVDQASTQRERDRVASIASKRRQFARVPVLLTDDTQPIPGSKVRVTWPGKGLNAGADFVLIGFRRSYLGARAGLLLWR